MFIAKLYFPTYLIFMYCFLMHSRAVWVVGLLHCREAITSCGVKHFSYRVWCITGTFRLIPVNSGLCVKINVCMFLFSTTSRL